MRICSVWLVWICKLSTSVDGTLMLIDCARTNYFPIPLQTACPDLVDNENLFLSYATWTPEVSTALHYSGVQQSDRGSALADPNWYDVSFLPAMREYRKGPLVYSRSNVTKEASEGETPKQWAIYKDQVYDLSDYFATVEANPAVDQYAFLSSAITNLWQGRAGNDVTKALDGLSISDTEREQTVCLSPNYVAWH